MGTRGVWGGGEIYLCADFELCQKTYKVNKFVQHLWLINEIRNKMYHLIMSNGGKEELNSKRVKGEQSKGSMVYIQDCKSETEYTLVLISTIKIEGINLLFMGHKDWNYINITAH